MRTVWIGLVGLLGLVCASLAAAAGEPDVNGLWRGSVYGSNVQAFVEQQSSDVKAQVIIRDILGETNIYHVFGSIEDGHMVLTHPPSGHRFEGLARDGEISGVLTLKSGMKVEVKALRVPMENGNGQGSSRQGALSDGRKPG